MAQSMARQKAVWCFTLGLCVLLLGGCSQRSRTARHLARGQKYFDKQQYQAAAIEYMNVLRNDSTNAVATRQMGLALFELGDVRGAFQLLLKAEARQTNDTVVALKVGALYLVGGDRGKARARAARVLDREAGNFDALMLWAGTAATSNDVQEALTRMDATAARFEDRPRFHIVRAALFLQMRDVAAAENVYRTALAKHPKAWELHQALGDLHMLKRDKARAGEEYQAAADLAPKDAGAWWRLARFEWASGKSDKAKQILESVGKDDPNVNRAKLGLAEIAFSERDYATCLTILERILKGSPSDVEAYLLYQRVKLAQGKTDEAIAGYERMISAHPKSPQGHFLLGVALLQKGDARKAAAALEQALAADADHHDAVRILAELYLRMNETDSAVRLLEGLTQRRPKVPFAYALLGSAYSAKKDFAKAADAYNKFIQLTPASPMGPHLMGATLLKLGREKEARTMFEEALKVDGAYVDSLEQLALLDAGPARNYEAGIARIRKQIEKVPDKAALRYLLGMFHVRQKAWDEAEKALQEAVDLQPDSTAAYFALSQLYAETKRDDASLAQLDKALQVNSNNVAALMLKGTILQRKKQADLAAAQYERILKIRETFFPAVNNLACLYWEDPKTRDRAFELAKQARNLAPKDPFVADTLGWMAYQRGDHRWAMLLMRESAEQLPKQPEVMYHLGMCEMMMGDQEGAAEALEKALEPGQEFPGREEAVKMLALLKRAEEGAWLATREAAEALLAEYPGCPPAMVRAGAAYERLGDDERAAKLYEKAIADAPFYVPGLVRLAKLRMAKDNDVERALTLAKQAREYAPLDPRAADALGWALFKKGDYKWALSLLTESAGKRPDDPEILYHVGMASYVSGRTEAGVDLIRRAVQKSGSFPGAKEAGEFVDLAKQSQETLVKAGVSGGEDITNPGRLPVLMALAAADVQKGDLPKAKGAYQRVVGRYPDFVPAIKELAVIYAREKNTSDEAFKMVSKARELLPADLEVAEALGRMAYQRRQYAYAARLLQDCADRSAGGADVLYYLGMSYNNLRNNELAKKTLKRALELAPESELAAEARKIVGQP